MTLTELIDAIDERFPGEYLAVNFEVQRHRDGETKVEWIVTCPGSPYVGETPEIVLAKIDAAWSRNKPKLHLVDTHNIKSRAGGCR